jgi:hypothetical protein
MAEPSPLDPNGIEARIAATLEGFTDREIVEAEASARRRLPGAFGPRSLGDRDDEPFKIACALVVLFKRYDDLVSRNIARALARDAASGTEPRDASPLDLDALAAAAEGPYGVHEDAGGGPPDGTIRDARGDTLAFLCLSVAVDSPTAKLLAAAPALLELARAQAAYIEAIRSGGVPCTCEACEAIPYVIAYVAARDALVAAGGRP